MRIWLKCYTVGMTFFRRLIRYLRYLLGLSGVAATCLFAVPNLDKLEQLAFSKFGGGVARFIGGWRYALPTGPGIADREKLDRINSFFNQRYRYVSDDVLWGQIDFWATLLDSASKSAGDCEDFAIAKYVSLLNAGVEENKLRLTYVLARVTVNGVSVSEPHMVLAYYPEPGAEPLILDNLNFEIKLASTRTDLAPVYAFNSSGMWLRGADQSAADPTTRISKWRDVLTRLQQEHTL